MTCHESRERLSELLDEVLPAPERAEVDAHLADCPECRRELERLRATVSLLQRVEPVRAPAGFVDRVMAAVRPVPWYRRLAAWIFLPLLIKLPAEAAAMALVAILAVYLFQRDPELRRTVRPELQATPPRAEAPAPREEQPASSLASPPLKAGKVEKGTAVERAREKFSYAERGAQDERAMTQDAPERPPRILAPAPSAQANRQAVAPSLSGLLAVKDRRAAEQGLAELLVRVGGSEISRRRDAAQSVVEVAVPEARYVEFARGLTALGVWSPEPHPTVLSTEPAQLRVTIRISE